MRTSCDVGSRDARHAQSDEFVAASAGQQRHANATAVSDAAATVCAPARLWYATTNADATTVSYAAARICYAAAVPNATNAADADAADATNADAANATDAHATNATVSYADDEPGVTS